MIDQGKHCILGVRINAVDYEAAVNCVLAAARRSQPLAVSALAVHGVMTGTLDPLHRRRLNDFDLLVPDGQPVRWALNLLYRAGLPDRVYGPTLMLKICERAADEGLPICLLGSTGSVLNSLKDNLLRRYPNLQITAAIPSRFRKLTVEEQDATNATIRASGARITFLGLGCPRQEVSAFELRHALAMPVIAVGAAFPFHAGVLPQAPAAWQNAGLEWLYRLGREPLRLWKRYLLLNPLYLTLLFLQAIGLHAYDPEPQVMPLEPICYG